jgi:hypothetical protein
MKHRLILLISALSSQCGAQTEADLSLIRKVTWGRVAFCEPSIIDELQIVGDVRKLSVAEATDLGMIFGKEASWHERQPDGSVKALMVFSPRPPNFKFLLGNLDSSTVVAIRLETSSGAASLSINGDNVKVPALREAARVELIKLLDRWFPGWKEISAKKEREWERKRREKQL